MRFWFFCFLILCAAFAASPASAQKSYSAKGYSSCHCDFGYPGSSCMPIVSCRDEGGRCKGRCVRQRE